MKKETLAAQTISASELVYGNSNLASTAYDAAVKKFLAQKLFLAHIMKGCIPEYKDYSIEEIQTQFIDGEPQISSVGVDEDTTNPTLPKKSTPLINAGNSELKTMSEGTSYFDIRLNAWRPNGDEKIRIIINIEAQNKENVGYPITARGVYYGCRLISSQNNVEFTDSHYEDIKKVFSIWIIPDPVKNKANTLTRYCITEHPIIGNARDSENGYDLLDVYLIRLGDLPVDADGHLDEGNFAKNITGLLSVLLKGNLSADKRKELLESMYDIPMTEEIESEVLNLCNLSDGIRNEEQKKFILSMYQNDISLEKIAAICGCAIENIVRILTSMGYAVKQ